MTTLHFVILALATWRLASLFANEHGPLDLFGRIRRLAGAKCPNENEPGDCESTNWFTKGLLCEWCNSVWFGTLITIAYVIIGKTFVLIVTPLAFSTIAIIIKYVVQTMQKRMEDK